MILSGGKTSVSNFIKIRPLVIELNYADGYAEKTNPI